MIINNKHIQGIFLYSKDVEYERGDFVVSNDCIYICTAAHPTDEEKKTVMGINPASDTLGNFKAYPGEMITSAEEYYNYVNSIPVWEFRYTLSEVEWELGIINTAIITVTSRDQLPDINTEGTVVKIEETNEYAFIPWKKDKYVSGSVLNQILQDSFFGVNENGVITNNVYSDTDYSINGTIAGIEDHNILDSIMKSPDLNNGMFNISRNLPEISAYVYSETAETNTVLLKQYTYLDNTTNKRVRIQELVDPEQGTTFYRWAEGTYLNVEEYSSEVTYRFNDIVIYNSKFWISVQTDNRGNTPESNSDYWTLFDGEWSYNIINQWRSSFEINQDTNTSNNILSQINAIRAYYQKKLNELEATREQLVGTFCNRNVDTNQNNEYDTNESGDIVLTAGGNIRMHSSWEYIEGGEESVLATLQVDSFNEVISLFPSTQFLNSYINPLALGANTVVRVGTETNYTYSYYRVGTSAWTHTSLNNLSQISTEFGVDSFIDIFTTDSSFCTNLISIAPDFPYTVFLKNRDTNTIYVALGNVKVSVPAGGTRSATPNSSDTRIYTELSKSLLGESGVADGLTKIYYEDLVNMTNILSTTLNAHGDYGNIFVCTKSATQAGITATDSSNIPIPLIYPVDVSNGNGRYLYLYRSSFYNIIPKVNVDNTDPEFPIYYLNNLDVYTQGDLYTSDYEIGDKIIIKDNITDNYGKVYEVRHAIQSGDPVQPDDIDFVENWENVIKSYPWSCSYNINTVGEKKDIDNLFKALNQPYRVDSQKVVNGSRYNSFWQGLVFGPSEFEETPAHYIQYYPKNSLVFNHGDYWTNKKEIFGNYDNPIIPGDDPTYWTRVDNVIVPDYDQIFNDNDWKTDIQHYTHAPAPLGFPILDFNVNAFKSLNSNISNTNIPGFFCIIYPSFYDNSTTSIKYVGSTITNYPEIPFFAWFDFDSGKCFLLRAYNTNTHKYTDSQDLVPFFKKICRNFLNRLYPNMTSEELSQQVNSNYTELEKHWTLPNYSYINSEKIIGGIKYTVNTTFDNVNTPNMLFRLDSKTTENNRNNEYYYTQYVTGKPVRNGNNFENIEVLSSLKPENISYYTDSIRQQIFELDETQVNFHGSLGLSSVQISPIYSNYLKNVIRIGPREYKDYLYYLQQNMKLDWVSILVSEECCIDSVNTRNDLDDLMFVDLGDCYFVESESKAYQYRYVLYPKGDLRYTLEHLRKPLDLYWQRNVYYDYNEQQWSNWSVYSSDKLLNETPVYEVPDIRDSKLGDFSDNLNEGTSLYAEKVLRSLKARVTCIVKDGSNYYFTTDGGTVYETSDFNDLIEVIKSRCIILDESKLDLNPYYLPYHIVADCSEFPEYPMEYSYKKAESYISNPLENWNASINLVDSTQLVLSDSTSYDETVTYHVGDTVYFNHAIWKCIQEVTNHTPADNSEYWTRYSLLDSVTEIPLDVLSNYNPSVRTVCKITHDGISRYYINGNYWIQSRPQRNTGYNDSPDYPNISSVKDLPDAFNLGLVWATERLNNNEYRCWRVVQNPGWFVCQAGSYSDTNRSGEVRPSWVDSSSNIGYSSAEEALFDTLQASYILGPNHAIYGIFYDPTLDYTVGQEVVHENIIWVCMQANGHDDPKIPTTTEDYWKPSGDPLFQTLSYIPSEISLLSIDPSVPFRLMSKVGNEQNYFVAVNRTQASFDASCIITILIYETINNNSGNEITKTYSITLDANELRKYYVTDNLTIEIEASGNNDEQRILKLRRPNNTPANGVFIKNIYYRYIL